MNFFELEKTPYFTEWQQVGGPNDADVLFPTNDYICRLDDPQNDLTGIQIGLIEYLDADSEYTVYDTDSIPLATYSAFTPNIVRIKVTRMVETPFDEIL